MDPPEELASPAAMRELIQYFETHGRLLDRQELGDGSAQMPQGANSFVSCIRFNGVPILPPVMTSSRVEEVRQDRHSAVFKEKRLKARQRKHLMEVAHQLVESTEQRRPTSETRPGKTSRLPIERPSVLRPVVSSAWGSVTASSMSTATAQSMESMAATGASSLANTFATAEQGQDDIGLQTLDSVCSDFMSLEETLPTDFNGVPLTSVRQQMISHDLLRLSKVLNVKDFNSTGGSDTSELPLSGSTAMGDSVGEVKSRVTSALDNVSASFFHESQDTVVEVAPENNTSGFVDNSIEGSPVVNREQQFSGGGGSANTSGMSSANTTGTTDSHRSSRSSPRSLKSNTVHFASFITEYIDTSASLSSENITVVKKKLPVDQQVIGSKQQGSKVEAPASSTTISLRGDEKGVDENGLLNNVSLAEPDSPVTPTPNPDPSSLPFQQYAKIDPSSSDKENDAKQANKMSSARMNPSNPSSASQRPPSKSGGRGSALQAGGSTSVTDSQGSSRSDATAATSESSNSTLIEDVATAASRDSTTSLPLNIVEGPEEGAHSSGREPEKKAGSTVAAAAVVPVARKPKKLPPEPPEGAYQHHSRQVKVVKDKNPSGKDAAVSGFHKGHVRRGSYTLSEPSPALVRAQSCPPVGAGGVGLDEDDDDHTKPLNIPSQPQPAVPSDSEAMGKAEHINKYLSHLSQVQLHSSEDVTASQMSADLHPLSRSQASIGSLGGGEVVEEFEMLRHNLMESQKKELEELFISQRREQMLLQGEIEEHQKRLKEQQDFLVSNAPENIKVQSQSHGGELSPSSSTGEESNHQRFNFPGPKQTQFNLHNKHGGTGVAPSDPLLLNTSSSSTSPRVRRPVLRSPVKFHTGRRNFGRVVVPPEAYEPEMMVKFEKLTAAAKGFLTRCLLHSDKVQELVKTIKDTREFAFSFQSETPIRKGNLSNQDRTLLERIVAQLQAALLDIHEIFFETPVNEQMAFIEQTRTNNREKRIKSSTDESVRSSGPRISTATLKAQERRRRAQEAESIVFGASSARPRTAPSSTSSPRSRSSMDISASLKRHYQFLLSKAKKPVAMHAAHLAHLAHQHPPVSPVRPDSSRVEKNRPQTAPERSTSSRPKKPVSASVAASSNHALENVTVQPKFNIRVKQLPQQQQAQPSGLSKQSSKLAKASSKSWR